MKLAIFTRVCVVVCGDMPAREHPMDYAHDPGYVVSFVLCNGYNGLLTRTNTIYDPLKNMGTCLHEAIGTDNAIITRQGNLPSLLVFHLVYGLCVLTFQYVPSGSLADVPPISFGDTRTNVLIWGNMNNGIFRLTRTIFLLKIIHAVHPCTV